MSLSTWVFQTDTPKVVVLDNFIDNLYKRTFLYEQSYINKIALQHREAAKSVAAFRFEGLWDL